MYRFLSILCIVCVMALAKNEQEIQRIENSIKVYYKNQKINFLHIHKMKNGRYFVIVKTRNTQDRVTVDKSGKILSIIDDLSIVNGAEEGC